MAVMVFFLIGPIDRRRPVVCVVRATPLSRSFIGDRLAKTDGT
jgi:hypothetical protein